MKRSSAFWSLIFLVASLVAAQQCSPPCPADLICIDGACVPVASASSQSTDGSDGSLEIVDELDGSEPAVDESSSAASVMQTFDDEGGDPGPGAGECARNGGCRPYERCIGGTCRDESDVRDAGTFGFSSAGAVYGIGAAYCSFSPILWSVVIGVRNEVTLAFNVPQKAAVVLPGLGCQLAALKQRRTLQQLGVKNPNNGLYATGWVLYGLVVASSVVNSVALGSDYSEFATVSSVANAAVLVASFTLNVVEYHRHRSLLRTTVDRVNVTRRAGVSVAPYLSYTRNRVGSGVTLAF